MKYKYNLSNLDCANCARRIEEALNKDSNIKNAVVNFSNLKLTFETDYNKDVLKYVKKIINRVEPDVVIYENDIKKENIFYDLLKLIIGLIIGIIGLILKNNIIILVSYIILLYKVFVKALKILVKDKSLDENFLITISCIGAFLIDKQSEGLMVIVLYEIGKILESKALNNSRKSISDLMNIKPLFANVKKNNDIIKTNPDLVNIGDIIIVKTGEKIPLDGVILNGTASLNTSAITGESSLKKVKPGDEVLSGMINEEGFIEISAKTLYENSTVNKMLELVENATNTKAKTETFVSRLAKIYTPVVFLLAILVVLYGAIYSNDEIQKWIYKALVFLVISCPCAIVISVPLSYFAGIGKCSKAGILVKGSNYLDNIKNIKKIIFDKTGTLTTGKFEHLKINIKDEKYKINELKEIIVKGESFSNHPIAKSLIAKMNINVDNKDVKNFKEVKGMGISFEIKNDKIKIGNDKFCGLEDSDSYIYISINNSLIATLTIEDEIRKEALITVKDLKKKKIICELFTGDNKKRAIEVGKKLGIEKIHYELLPQDKYNLIKSYIDKDNEIVAFVGDGINDAIVLAISHIGISMGGIGQESAIEASDVVIMDDDLTKINEAINISKYTSRIIKENLIFALGVKVLVLLLSIFGVASMWQAVFADVGVTLLTILNTMRILKNK